MTRADSRAIRRRGLVGLAVALPLTFAMGVGAVAAAPQAPSNENAAAASSSDQGNHGKPPTLEARAKQIITATGREFKDLNANGKLDVYEDWRKPVDARVADLVAQMTLEEKAGLMLIDTVNASCDPATGEFGTVPDVAADYIGTQQMHRLIFRNVVDTGTRGACEAGGGGFATNVRVTPAEAATFMNSIQEMSEATRLGIPVLYKSNARNHIDPQARAGINEASGSFSAFPKEAGIAAAALGEQAKATGEATDGDMSVVEDFADGHGRRVVVDRPARHVRLHGRPVDRPALVPHARDLHRGRRPGREHHGPAREVAAGRGRQGRQLAERRDRRRAHDEALPGRWPAGARPRPALRLRQGAGLPG